VGLRLGEIAEYVGCELRGEPDTTIERVCTLQAGVADGISFLANPHYRQFLPDTRAGAVILAGADADQCPVAALLADDPYVTYARVAQLLYPVTAPESGIDPSAVVAPGARVDATAYVGPNVVIETGVRVGPGSLIGAGCILQQDCRVGENTRLIANITLCRQVVIGDRVLIHPGVVIGSDGFGIANDHGVWVKLPQVGGVRIGNDVEIGANTTIDRGAVEDTVIEDGVKLDNQIQVAHNVYIGAHTAIAGCTAIAGSARIGKHCMIGGAVGITGHLEIADGVVITAMTLVTKSIARPGLYSSGLASMPNKQWNKTLIRLRQLDDMAKRLAALEKKLDK